MKSGTKKVQSLEELVQGSTLMATVLCHSNWIQDTLDILGFNEDSILADRFYKGTKLIGFESPLGEKGESYTKYTVELTHEVLSKNNFAWILFLLSPISKNRKKFPLEGLTLRATLTPWRFAKFTEWLDMGPTLKDRLEDLGEPPISRDVERSRWVWLDGHKLKNGQVETTVGLNFRFFGLHGRDTNHFAQQLTDALGWIP